MSMLGVLPKQAASRLEPNPDEIADVFRDRRKSSVVETATKGLGTSRLWGTHFSARVLWTNLQQIESRSFFTQ